MAVRHDLYPFIEDEDRGLRDLVRKDPKSSFGAKILSRYDYTPNDGDISYINENPNSDWAATMAPRKDVPIASILSTARANPDSRLAKVLSIRTDYVPDDTDKAMARAN